MLHVADFWAQWCPPCRALKPRFLALADDKNWGCKVRYATVRYDVPGKVNGELFGSSYYNIRGFPTL